MRSFILPFAFAPAMLLAQGHPDPASVPAPIEKLIKWTSIEDAQKAAKVDGHPLFVDMSTPWCGWCRKLESTTFADKQTADYINAHYHPVSFNAEGPDPVMFNGKKYENPQYAGQGGRHGTHQLTMEIAAPNGRLAYPTIVYIDSEGKVIAPVQAYMGPEDIEPVLIYIAEGFYKTQPDFQSYKTAFKSRRVPQ